MEYEKILELIKIMEDSSLTTFSYKEGDSEILLKKEVTAVKQVEAAPAKVKEATEPAGDGVEYIKAELIGTFYEAPSPQAKAFVSVGDKITKGQVVGIIEAMKMMNEVVSEYEGTVEAILVENEQMIEYGQPLFKIKTV
ncbi:acetyl-CoA carboxylase biotin carboxyl carrier protein [Intestinibacter sp.]|uniref:acetyl-CoA carboxylase biotin carboxyl carrier protein n=1 Tax=Intestinibacter sp. TaxID=1965304 RepID=UPI0025C57854|nr:biotin/lipoyl-containing protein [Intestinibacter sp.]MCI6737344.1 acetyl-CoA carboxylase, biotin carboxyl carrier protein [Intestinibacter sp.]MDY2734805.1 biotin/lipoyl-containing protein [Intestinibacter sp.]MDY4574659.1 biotin/lipoyl-containing protein [Intestinibacter sp.]